MSELFNKQSLHRLVQLAARDEEYLDNGEIKKRLIPVEWDAVFFDRDGLKYNGFCQHVHASEPGHRVWVDAQGSVVMFKAYDADRPDRAEWFKISVSQDLSQIQEPIRPGDAAAIAAGAKEYKCVTVMVGGGGFTDMQSATEKYANLFKIPVVDMLVEFGNARTGTRINHVSNVRHARYTQSGVGLNRTPCYVLLSDKPDAAAQQRDQVAELAERAQKAEAELAAMKAAAALPAAGGQIPEAFTTSTPGQTFEANGGAVRDLEANVSGQQLLQEQNAEAAPEVVEPLKPEDPPAKPKPKARAKKAK